jgi:hypothetical protein
VKFVSEIFLKKNFGGSKLYFVNARYFTSVLLALLFAGCAPFTVQDDVSKRTVELTSSEPSPSGHCRIYDELGRLMLEGTLSSGKMDGTWTSFSSQSKLPLATWSFHNGLRNGTVQMWYGPLAYPGASGHINTEGTFLDGVYDGKVTSYYSDGSKRAERIYDHGVLKNCQYWSPDGTEFSKAEAIAEGNRETKSDMIYLASLENSVTQSLAQAHRKIQP